MSQQHPARIVLTPPGPRASLTSVMARTPPGSPALNCPICARDFLIGPAFVMDVAATGRIRKSERGAKRAEVRCGICGHRWWSRHPEALKKARARARELHGTINRRVR